MKGERVEGRGSRFRRALKANTVSGLANALFGDLADRYSNQFPDLDSDLERADINVLFRTYVSQMFLAVFLAFLTGILGGILIVTALGTGMFLSVVTVLTLPFILAIGVFLIMYYYPSWRASRRTSSIESNLPFALNHMNSVAGAGVTPSSMFELFVNFREYGEISREAEKIVTRVHAFGEDITTAIKEVARKTPSEQFQMVLYGMVSTIESGGDLRDYISESSERALFEYRIRRRKYTDRLSTFAVFYTALLVAAPLFLIVLLVILEAVGGNTFGVPIKASCGFLGMLGGVCPPGVIDIGAYVLIPFANIVFILLLEVTQPEI